MSAPSPEDLARGHSSRWIRLVIRTLSIRGLAWFLFAIGLLATGIVCQQASRGRQDAVKTRFQADSTILQNAMLERLHRYAQTLQGVRGLFAASRDVEKSEFHDYVASLQTGINDPGILALGFIEEVDLADRSAFISKAILEHDASFRIHPPGERPDYFVVRFVEPHATNLPALGFDIGSEPTRREAAMKARDSGRAVLTPRIELVQAMGRPGAILLEPVYSGGIVPASIDGRRAHLQGWVYAAFVVEDMMAGVRKLTNSPLQYEILDGSDPSASDLLCGNPADAGETTPGGLDQRVTLNIYGRPWRLSTHSPGGNSHGPGMLPIGILAAGGICMSLLIFGTAQSMATTSSRACSLAAGMTEELRMTNQELQDSQTRLQATLADLEASHKKLEQTQLELIQAAKLESVGTLAAGVAHEVKNPLQIIMMGLDFLDHRLHAGDHVTRATLADMRDATLRADSITRELLHFSSASEFNPCPADLESVLDRSLWLLRTDITKSGVTVVKHLAGNLPTVAIDTPKIQQVLINLIINALQAMDRSGTLTLATASGQLERLLPATSSRIACPLPLEEPSVVLRLQDTGPGIPENQLLRIFDPFFTTKAVGTGTGLGLSVAKRIIDLHGGFIHFRNSPQGGLEVTLAFAAARQPSAVSPGMVLTTQA